MRWLGVALLLSSTFPLGCCDIPSLTGDKNCTKDTDCKGERVCLQGECRQPTTEQPTPVSPGTTPTATIAPTTTADNGPPEEYVVSVPGGSRTGTVRAEPGFNGTIVSQLEPGTHVGVTGRSDDSIWMRIKWPYPHGSNTGWMHRDILARPEAVPPPPATTPPAGEACSPMGATCNLPRGRWGYCNGQGICQDVCPRGMSYHPHDARCHQRCREVTCNECMGGLCMDPDKSVNPR